MEGLRGYAAFIIYALHLIGQYYNRRMSIDFDDFGLSDISLDAPGAALAYWIHSSHYGVDIFFALSGYLIAGLVVKETFHYVPYLLNRVMRIYPVLVVSTFMYVAYGVVFKDGGIWWGGIVGNLLLLNGIKGIDFPAINIVTWSLFFEMAFYIAFPLIWGLAGKSLLRFLCISMAIIVFLSTINNDYVRFTMFLAGVSLRMMPIESLDRIRSFFTDKWVAVIYVTAAAFFMVTKNFLYFIPVFIAPCMLLIDRVLNVDGWLRRIFSWRWIRYFGNISFSFYIYHPLGLSVATAILTSYTGLGNLSYFTAFAILSFGFSVLFATASYLLVERLYFIVKR
ncbi:acyltransferase [Seongchinamella sediminis]|uniref:Acyltransferase n=2 Tax=Seongchinamella sediminis TaxID=2283635 RepID=A0A3L7DVF3_9GAMM|nr:acyltransferase [Seongchinamella sediminis]